MASQKRRSGAVETLDLLGLDGIILEVIGLPVLTMAFRGLGLTYSDTEKQWIVFDNEKWRRAIAYEGQNEKPIPAASE